MAQLSTVDIIDKRRTRCENLRAELAHVVQQIIDLQERDAIRHEVFKGLNRGLATAMYLETADKRTSQELQMLTERKYELEQMLHSNGLKVRHRIQYIAGRLGRSIKGVFWRTRTCPPHIAAQDDMPLMDVSVEIVKPLDTAH